MKKNLLGQYGTLVACMLLALMIVVSYFIGYNKAIRDAEPYVDDGVQYIIFDGEVHEYGTL